MKDGFFLLHRKFLDNPLLNVKPFCKGYAWITILALTNHKEGFIRVKNGTLVKIQRGECGYSEKALADIFGWSRGKVRRFLEQLKIEKMIQQKIVENHSIIKILNYKSYQTEQQKKEKTDTKRYNKRTQTNNDKEEYININNTHTNNIESVCEKNISSEDMKILRKYAKENGARNLKPYINKLIENGGYIQILNEEKARIEKEKQKAQRYALSVEVPPEKIETKEETELARAKYLEATKKLRRRKTDG